MPESLDVAELQTLRDSGLLSTPEPKTAKGKKGKALDSESPLRNPSHIVFVGDPAHGEPPILVPSCKDEDHLLPSHWIPRISFYPVVHSQVLSKCSL